MRRDWDRLYDGARSFSQSVTFAQAVLAAGKATGQNLYIAVLETEHGIEGLWPLRARRGFHREMFPLTAGPRSEYSYPLVADPEALTALLQGVLDQARGRWDRVWLYNAPEGSPLDLAAARLRPAGRSGVIEGFDIPHERFPTTDALRAALSSRLRKALAADQRRLQRLGRLSIAWTSPQDSPDGVDFLLRTKRDWARRRRLSAPWLADAFSRLCLQRLARTPHTLCQVRLDDRPLAAALCLPGPGRLEMLVTTYDPAWAAYSPGRLLTGWLAEQGVEMGGDVDFRILDAAYKRRWPVISRRYVTRCFRTSPWGWAPTPAEVMRGLRRTFGPPIKALRRAVGRGRPQPAP